MTSASRWWTVVAVISILLPTIMSAQIPTSRDLVTQAALARETFSNKVAPEATDMAIQNRVAHFLEHIAKVLPVQVARLKEKNINDANHDLSKSQEQLLKKMASDAAVYARSGGKEYKISKFSPLAWFDSLQKVSAGSGVDIAAAWVRQDPYYGANGLWIVTPILDRLVVEYGLRQSVLRFATALLQCAPHIWSYEAREEMKASGHTLVGAVLLADGDTLSAMQSLLAAAQHPYASAAAPAAARLRDLAVVRRDTTNWLIAATLKRLKIALVDSTEEAQLQDLYTRYVTAHGRAPDVIQNRMDDVKSQTPLSWEAYLDRQWAVVFERGFPVVPFSRTGKHLPGRIVVLEYTTGIHCSSCNWHDHAMHPLVRRYTSGDVVPLAFHTEVMMPKRDTVMERWFSWYPAYAENPNWGFNFRGRTTSVIPFRTLIAPSGEILQDDFVNGRGLPKDPSTRSSPLGQRLYERLIARIDQELQRPPEVQLHLTASTVGEQIHVKVQVDSLRGNHSTLALRIVLFEDTVKVLNESSRRIYQNVVRGFARSDSLTFGVPLSLSASRASISYTFDVGEIRSMLKSEGSIYQGLLVTEIDPARLSLVAFVQDLETSDVLQAAVIKVPWRSTVMQK